MNINSPIYCRKVSQPANNQEEFRSPDFKSPFTSPQNKSPGISPFNSSSPQKTRGNPKRYFNNSGNGASPYKQRNKNNKSYFPKGGRGSTETPDILSYYDRSAVLNPWEELEREYEVKRDGEAKA